MRRIVSVVIPNHGRDISNVINAIKASTYPHIEIIVVDEGLGRSKQRNIGIKRAKGEYLLILDSDMVIAPDLILDCVRLIKTCNGVYLRERIMTPGLFARIRNWERQFYTGTLIDCVRFVRRKDCPFFDETMDGPEDADWDRLILEPKVVSNTWYYHYEDVNMWQYFKKKAYYAKSMARYKSKNPTDRVLDFKYRCWTVFVENGKWKALLHPYVFGLIFTIAIRGFIYIWNVRKR